MAGNREAGLKTAAKLKAKNPNFFSEIGADGGSTITENTHRKGFGSLTKEQRSEMGRKGAAKRIANLRKNG